MVCRRTRKNCSSSLSPPATDGRVSSLSSRKPLLPVTDITDIRIRHSDHN